MDCAHDERDPVFGDGHKLVAQVCRGCGEEWPADMGAVLSLPLSPAAEAEQILRARAFLDSLPDASGTFSGYLITDDGE